MSHQRKSTQRKTSRSSTSSASNDLWEIIDQPSQSSSIRRPSYPNVPKRTQRMPSINEHESIQTESRITIIPTNKPSEKLNSYASTSNDNAHTRLNLDLIDKYTSPQIRTQQRSLSPTENDIKKFNIREPIYTSKSKRTLSPLDEFNRQNHEPKRTKSPDDDDDNEDELSQLLDHRIMKQILSQSTISDNDNEKKPPIRKPTVRKLSNSQQRSLNNNIQTQPVMKISCQSPEMLMIEPDLDVEEDHLIYHEETNPSRKSYTKLEDLLNRALPTDINLLDSLNPSSITKDYHSIRSPLYNTLKQTIEHPIDHSSPHSNVMDGQQSTTSSTSLFYDTPRSSLSRTTNSNSNSTPQSIIKHDRETQISIPSKIDLLNQLIHQTNVHINQNSNEIDYNPGELSTRFFYQCKSCFTTNKYLTMNELIKKQFLHFGRYEIEVEYPNNNDKISTIYACDICLKHFNGSSIAYQRHLSKCLTTQPPGKLVYKENDLAIFEIGKTIMTMEQCIYMKYLHRITRLFIDSTKTIDDRKIDQFTYYILCRQDPILSEFQSSFYRFIGYFSKEHNQSTPTPLHNLSCLTILPPFIRYQRYNQLLIAFSYFLIRSNTSINQIFSTPVRPLDNSILACFRIFWRDMIFAYFNNQKSSSIQTITLDTLARNICIHPRDILSSLYSNNSIITYSNEKSCIYLRNNPSNSVPSLNQLLLMNTNSMIHDKNNMNKDHDNSIEEIVLD